MKFEEFKKLERIKPTPEELRMVGVPTGKHFSEYGEQLELFVPAWYSRTKEQESAAADVFRWLEDHIIYYPVGSPGLMDVAKRYAELCAPNIYSILRKLKFNEAEQAEIMADYYAAAQGVTHYTAAPELMAKAVKTLSRRDVYEIDKFLFFPMVYLGYNARLRIISEYESEKREMTPEMTRLLLFVQKYGFGTFGDAILWAVNFGFLDLCEFADVKTLEEGVLWGRNARFYADWERYTRFYWFAKNALIATDNELESISLPPQLRKDEFFKLSIEKTLEQYDKLNQWARDYLKDKPTAAAISRPLAALGAGGKIEYKLKKGGIIGNSLLSLLKVQQERGEIQAMMYATVEQVFKGVNLYFAANRFHIEKGERQNTFVYNTTFTDFARNCGYKDRESNQKNREQLRAAMALLNAVNVSPRIYERSPVVFIFRTEKEKTNEDFLEIRVLPEYISGANRLLINCEEVEKLRSLGGRNGVELRFYNLTLTRGHKREEEIIKQIWNYEAEKYEAERLDAEAAKRGETPEKVAKFRANWSKHYNGRRKKLERFFLEARACGALYWFEYFPKKDGGVYTWGREPKTAVLQNTKIEKSSKKPKRG